MQITASIPELNRMIILLEEINGKLEKELQTRIYLEERMHTLGNAITGKMGMTEAEVMIKQIIADELSKVKSK